ncbi:TonB-dependent receptor plug domain-containing protein [Apibacter raozihei]|uniref:TonB-dependent receptor plug domain-containing protein n=1 Tax=Apibacter raozihei TaxID=2500547 RepID=UPI000FE2A98E|nr:TonB-dependent receptor plug domain-containing protein [Apibacter raozihei]
MKTYITLLFISVGMLVSAQHSILKGKLFTSTEDGILVPINGADVHWKEHPVMKTVTDSLGNFELMYHAGLYNIIAEKEGFVQLEMKIESVNEPVELFMEAEKTAGEKSLNEIIIRERAKAVSIKSNSVSLTYTINKSELLKAACCNLAESFETNPTVDVSTTNAVTGSKQIKLLGLDQKYTSITVENMPEVRGLTSANGINYLPGTWINSIQLTKGGSTVNNGYEGITGQINTELLKFKDKNFTHINFFGNQNARLELNVVNATKLDRDWSNTSLIHLNGRFSKEDMNHDGFLDMPLSKQVNAMNILRYDGIQKNGWGSIFAVQALYDKQIGGEKKFRESTDRLTQNYYGLGIENSHFEIWNKTGYVFLNKPYQSIGLQTKYIHHNIDSYFGQRLYNGNQNTFFANLIFESIIGNTNNKYSLGASYLHDSYNEDFENVNFNRNESVPGLFAEYTNTSLKNLTVVAGIRSDFHNLAGTQILPRLNVKYSLFPKTTLRMSGGRGMRTANIFAENMQYFASSRKLHIKQNNGDVYGLQPEFAWNYGISMIQDFNVGKVKNTFTIDFYRTDFTNQVLTDLDHSAQELWIYNLEGKSYSNSFQAVWDIFPIQNLELHFAYKWYDIKAEYMDGKKQVPFTSKNRGLFTASYSTNETDKKSKWVFDFTLQYIGKQRLPDTSRNPLEFQKRAYSPDYGLMNAQISRHFSEKLRLYIGVENLGGYKQNHPIIDSENPFGSYFDTSVVYAPIVPAMFYAGFDVKL